MPLYLPDLMNVSNVTHLGRLHEELASPTLGQSTATGSNLAKVFPALGTSLESTCLVAVATKEMTIARAGQYLLWWSHDFQTDRTFKLFNDFGVDLGQIQVVLSDDNTKVLVIILVVDVFHDGFVIDVINIIQI